MIPTTTPATVEVRTTRPVRFHGWELPTGTLVAIERWSQFQLVTATGFEGVSATLLEAVPHAEVGERVSLPTYAVPARSYFPAEVA